MFPLCKHAEFLRRPNGVNGSNGHRSDRKVGGGSGFESDSVRDVATALPPPNSPCSKPSTRESLRRIMSEDHSSSAAWPPSEIILYEPKKSKKKRKDKRSRGEKLKEKKRNHGEKLTDYEKDHENDKGVPDLDHSLIDQSRSTKSRDSIAVDRSDDFHGKPAPIETNGISSPKKFTFDCFSPSSSENNSTDEEDSSAESSIILNRSEVYGTKTSSDSQADGDFNRSWTRPRYLGHLNSREESFIETQRSIVKDNNRSVRPRRPALDDISVEEPRKIKKKFSTSHTTMLSSKPSSQYSSQFSSPRIRTSPVLHRPILSSKTSMTSRISTPSRESTVRASPSRQTTPSRNSRFSSLTSPANATTFSEALSPTTALTPSRLTANLRQIAPTWQNLAPPWQQATPREEVAPLREEIPPLMEEAAPLRHEGAPLNLQVAAPQWRQATPTRQQMTPSRQQIMTPSRQQIVTPSRQQIMTPSRQQIMTPSRQQITTPSRQQTTTPSWQQMTPSRQNLTPSRQQLTPSRQQRPQQPVTPSRSATPSRATRPSTPSTPTTPSRWVNPELRSKGPASVVEPMLEVNTKATVLGATCNVGLILPGPGGDEGADAQVSSILSSASDQESDLKDTESDSFDEDDGTYTSVPRYFQNFGGPPRLEMAPSDEMENRGKKRILNNKSWRSRNNGCCVATRKHDPKRFSRASKNSSELMSDELCARLDRMEILDWCTTPRATGGYRRFR